MKTKYEEYVKVMRKAADISGAISLLSWDKEVNMPKNGAAFRSQQVATLAGMRHEMLLDARHGINLKMLYSDRNLLDSKERKNIEISHKHHERRSKLSTDFVMRQSKAVSNAYHSWIEAKKNKDYSLYKDALTEVVNIRKEECELVGYEDHPYEALLDQYEPGAKVAQLDTLFNDVKAQLVDFCKQIAAQKQVNADVLAQAYDKDKQWDFGLEILKRMGYDFNSGRQDLSPHPFTTHFAPTDVRVTTRIDENHFGSMTWSCIHEGGHALYELGLPQEEYGLPSGSSVSLGIHESQSRLWENNVGRSLPFWKHNFSLLKEFFPKELKGISVEDFYKAINQVYPSPIRVESDELYYHFHIMIRYEIEKGLIEGSLSTDGLNEVWNQKYKDYLGIDIQNDAEGILQDIHWAYGSIGYFPTYSLGSFYAAQFFNQAKKDIPNLIQEIEKGENQSLLTWLREQVHQHGSTYSADELCNRITGESLNFKYFMDYAKEKYKGIYQF